MIIGVPREIKQDEYRVGLVPAGALSVMTEDGVAAILSYSSGSARPEPDCDTYVW